MTKRTKTALRTAYAACGAALVTAAVLLAVYAVYGLFPMGRQTLSWCDMTQQGVPMLLNLKDILSGEGGMLLNLRNAGGMNFWGVFFFYVASPFAFLVKWVDRADVLLLMNVLVLLKMALAAATASVFFRCRFRRLPVTANLALSVSYACCGFALQYFQIVVWLDMMWSFPLLLLSLLRLLERRKPGAFILMLAFSVVLNYYISYMLVIFLLLGVPLWLLLCMPREAAPEAAPEAVPGVAPGVVPGVAPGVAGERGRTALLFILSCVAAALLSAPVWLPSFQQFLSSARVTKLTESLSAGSFFGEFATKLPLLLCTPLLLAAPPFLFVARVARANRARCGMQRWALVLFGLMLFGAAAEPVNKMWHTGNYQCFPVRFAYMAVFLGLILAAYAICAARPAHTPARTRTPSPAPMPARPAAAPLLGVAGAIVALIVLSVYLTKTHFTDLTAYTDSLHGSKRGALLLLLWSVAAAGVTALLFVLLRTRRIARQVFSAALLLTVLTGCVFCSGLYMGSAARSDRSYRLAADLTDRTDGDSTFFRVKAREKYFPANEIGGMGYNSLAHYTSLTDQAYLFAMKKLGYSGYWMEINSNGGTILTDAILRNRYTVSDTPAFAFSEDVVYRNDAYCLLRAAFDMPAAVRLSADPAAYALLPDCERWALQDVLYRLYTGTEDSVVTRYTDAAADGVTLTFSDGLYRFDVPENGVGTLRYEIAVRGRQALYFDAFKELSTQVHEALNGSFRVEVNGVCAQALYPNEDSNGFLYLGDYHDETVTVTVTVLRDAEVASYGVFSLDADKVAAACDAAAGCDLTLRRGGVEAEIEGRAGEYLYVSLPYADGYRVTVNGEPVQPERVLDTFCAIPLRDGQNRIAVRFVPDGLLPGCVLGAAGILFLAALLAAVRFGSTRRGMGRSRENGVFERALPGKIALGCMIAALVATVILIYLFPLAVYFFS